MRDARGVGGSKGKLKKRSEAKREVILARRGRLSDRRGSWGREGVYIERRQYGGVCIAATSRLNLVKCARYLDATRVNVCACVCCVRCATLCCVLLGLANV